MKRVSAFSGISQELPVIQSKGPANDHQGACPTLAPLHRLDRESEKGLYFT